MAFPKALLNHDPIGFDNCILHVYRGSISHGTFVPSTEPNSTDDKDTMGITIPPRNFYFGLHEYGSRGTREIKEGEWDVVLYEARKAFRMFLKGNPNILSMLWVDDRYVINKNAQGQYLRENRDIFVGRHVYQSFVGYAKAQYYKMEHGATMGYMGQKRKTLVEKFGYDTKQAGHLIRLLRMCAEFLKDGELYVDRGNLDAPELIAIKNGEWSLERVKTEAERLFIRCENLYDLSTLPLRPDEDKAEDLLDSIVYREFCARGEI